MVLSCSGFRRTDRFGGNGHKLCFFCFRKPANSKQAWCECHIINYFARAVLGNIGPRSFLYGPSAARSVLPRPRANIPQDGPRARLVVLSRNISLIFFTSTVTRSPWGKGFHSLILENNRNIQQKRTLILTHPRRNMVGYNTTGPQSLARSQTIS